MLRKIIISILTFSATTSGMLYIASYSPWPEGWMTPLGDRMQILLVSSHWTLIFDTTSPLDVPNNLSIHKGKLSLYRTKLLSLDPKNVQTQTRQRIEFGGYVFARGTAPRNIMGPLSRSLRKVLIIHFPLLPAFVVTATYPLVAYIRGPLRRWRRRRNGLCLNCGYNLTGNVSGVCPECGTEVPEHAAKPPKTAG